MPAAMVEDLQMRRRQGSRGDGLAVTLEAVMAAAEARCVPMTGEMAAYLVLGIADAVLEVPRAVLSSAVLLSDDGAVRVDSERPASAAQTEAALRALLAGLLEVAVSVTPALWRLSRQPAKQPTGRLVAELEAALVPANRMAARRALARLCRETWRASASGLVAPRPSRAGMPEPRVPVEAVPVEAVPVEAVPVEAVPVEAVPVEAVPVESMAEERASGSAPRADAGALPCEGPWERTQPLPDPVLDRGEPPVDPPASVADGIVSVFPEVAPTDRTPFLGTVAGPVLTAPVAPRSRPTPSERDGVDPVPSAPEGAGAPPRSSGYGPGRRSDVRELLERFSVAESRCEKELSRDLKRMVGVPVTPAPPGSAPAELSAAAPAPGGDPAP